MLKSYGFIYVQGPATDPAVDRVVIQRGGLRTTIVALPEQAAAVRVADELVQGGVQLIELCGIFGPEWTARVVEATGGRIPVGSVSYGAESVASLAALVAPEK